MAVLFDCTGSHATRSTPIECGGRDRSPGQKDLPAPDRGDGATVSARRPAEGSSGPAPSHVATSEFDLGGARYLLTESPLVRDAHELRRFDAILLGAVGTRRATWVIDRGLLLNFARARLDINHVRSPDSPRHTAPRVRRHPENTRGVRGGGRPLRRGTPRGRYPCSVNTQWSSSALLRTRSIGDGRERKHQRSPQTKCCTFAGDLWQRTFARRVRVPHRPTATTMRRACSTSSGPAPLRRDRHRHLFGDILTASAAPCGGIGWRQRNLTARTGPSCSSPFTDRARHRGTGREPDGGDPRSALISTPRRGRSAPDPQGVRRSLSGSPPRR